MAPCNTIVLQTEPYAYLCSIAHCGRHGKYRESITFRGWNTLVLQCWMVKIHQCHHFRIESAAWQVVDWYSGLFFGGCHGCDSHDIMDQAYAPTCAAGCNTLVLLAEQAPRVGLEPRTTSAMEWIIHQSGTLAAISAQNGQQIFFVAIRSGCGILSALVVNTGEWNDNRTHVGRSQGH